MSGLETEQVVASRRGAKEWDASTVAKSLARHPERLESFRNLSNNEVRRLYTQEDLDAVGFDADRDLGFPGEFPFTRGCQPTMYRGRIWTKRQVAGLGTAVESNQRYKYLTEQGQTGLSSAFDFPTLQGFDSDHEFSIGEVGKTGVACDSQKDTEILYDGIPLDEVSVSIIINGPAPMIWAMFLGAAERQGVPFQKLTGTLQNDILKEFQAQKMFVFPPGPSIELVMDTMEWGAQHAPRFNPVSISGYHIREAGATAVQELAFTMANGMDYVRRGIERGLDPNVFGQRLSFFFNAHNDFFEEIAKFRAARRIWARFMRDEAGVTDPRAMWMRFHTQTAGASCTREQPENNIVRTAVQAMAAVLGGTQSLHTNSFDEALALPSERSVRIALRTQQILAEESGVANTIDPLGGSYYLETLTTEMEGEAGDYFRRIESSGGVLRCIENGFFQREIADSAYRYQRSVENDERVIVGQNRYVMEEEPIEDLLSIDEEAGRRQIEHLRRLKGGDGRDNRAVETVLNRLTETCELDGADRVNLMPVLLEASRAYATLGEMREAMVAVYGEYKEVAIF